MRSYLACGCLTLALIGCGGELQIDSPPDAAPDAAPPPPVVPVIRVHSWPGTGVQLAVEVPERVAAETPGVLPTAWFESATGQRIDAVVAPAEVTTGITAVVLVPSADPTIHAMRVAAADALLRALPAGERVALFATEDHPQLLGDLALRRDHARARLAALAPEAGGLPTLALREVRDLLADAQSSHGALGRTAILVGDTAVEDPPEVPRLVNVLTMPVDGDPAAAATRIVGELLAHRATVVRVGACPGFVQGTPFTLHLGSGHAELSAPEVMDHVVDQPCDAAAAATDRYPYPSEIDLTFTPEERQVFDQLYASAQELPFRTSVKLGVGASLTAEGHLRGKGTLSCQRKSISIQLDTSRRRLMPGVATDHFFLISMCQDERYFGQVFGDRLLASLDLFSPHLHYVKLRIDGVNRGIYLLMDQPEGALRDNGLGIASVIRRRYDIDNEPAEVKFPDDPVLAAEELTRFEALGDLARNGPLADLDAELQARIDVDAYVRMLAAFSLLLNGDYIDEPFFYGSTEVGAEHYRTMAWDTDDLFSPCHSGRFIVDRCGLTYCAEAELDYALLRSPPTYNRFLRGMDEVLAQITPALMTTTMAAVKDDLWAALDDDETAAALIEMVQENPAAATVAGARADIEARMTNMLNTAIANHASLLGRRAMCLPTP